MRERVFGDVAQGLVHHTDTILFDEVWERDELSKRDRSLITVAKQVFADAADSD